MKSNKLNSKNTLPKAVKYVYLVPPAYSYIRNQSSNKNLGFVFDGQLFIVLSQTTKKKKMKNIIHNYLNKHN